MDDMVTEVSRLCGGSMLLEAAEKFGIHISDAFLNAIPECTFLGWEMLFKKARPEMQDEAAFDLLKKMLTVDHTLRITAKDAMEHRFFAPLKEKREVET